MDEILEIEVRRKIFNLIAKNPGLHAKRIAELISIQGQLADYHLLWLERKDVITAVREEGYTRYFIKGKIGIKERRRIAILRQEIPLRIVLYLIKHPNVQHKSTLTYHLKKLIKYQIINEQPSGKEKYYSIFDEKDVARLLGTVLV